MFEPLDFVQFTQENVKTSGLRFHPKRSDFRTVPVWGSPSRTLLDKGREKVEDLRRYKERDSREGGVSFGYRMVEQRDLDRWEDDRVSEEKTAISLEGEYSRGH